MSNRLTHLTVKNYRSLADVSLALGPVNVLFGPNGAGKSSLLDTIWFVRDCAIRGVDAASANRSHGIGMLWDGADQGDRIGITLATADIEYGLLLGLSSGRIDPFAGEHLYSLSRDRTLMDRGVGSDSAQFYHTTMQQDAAFTLREPEKLNLGRYVDYDSGASEAAELDRLLHHVHLYHSRSLNLYRIKHQGSEAGHECWLRHRGDNLWSVLRNLHDRRERDTRYDTIVGFMGESFPSFDGLYLEQTGPASIYGGFLEKGRRNEIRASGVSDGHLQLLLLLTALFAEGHDRDSLMLLDEPEASLHPWALAVLARAVRSAAGEWNKQVFIATHSPVLISQFDADQLVATETEDGQTRLTRVSEISDAKDLLEQYAAGSLYMAGEIAAQGPAREGHT